MVSHLIFASCYVRDTHCLCHFNFAIFFVLNSSTIDELGEGAWKDGAASSTGAERVG